MELLIAIGAAGGLAAALAAGYLAFETAVYLIHKHGPRGLVKHIKNIL